MRGIIRTEKALKPAGPYSQAVKVGGFIFISGQIALDPKECKIMASEIGGQTERTFKNIEAILKAANYNLSDIVQMTVYLSSMALFSDFNSIYAKYFDQDFPARATVGVELMPDALVEISAVAYKD